ncbi:MAG: RIP metalloprotease RseP [Firmicutes bacterium]|nr:RIP metalloprotease RseP [Bacillota bacterium]
MNATTLWDLFAGWVLPFAVVFGTIVLVHELGHFLVARRVGVKVHEFAIGFGRAVFQWKRGETRYSLRIFPLGGFVKLAGMDAAVDPAEEIDPEDHRNFQNKPLWQRMATIAAGPLANFALAVVLLIVFYAAVEVPFKVADVLPGSPAQAAGILPGDRIIAVEGNPVHNLADLTGTLQQFPDQTVEIVIERDGRELRVPVLAARDPQTGRVLIGVTVMGGATAGKERLPIGQSVVQAVRDTAQWTWSLIRWLGGIVSGQTPAEQVRDSVAGPIGIVVGLGESARSGIGYLLLFTAVLNVNLALVNLLPIPVLDGGWLLFLLIEAVRGKPLAPEHQGVAQFVGLTVLLALMAFVFYLDLTRLFG